MRARLVWLTAPLVLTIFSLAALAEGTAASPGDTGDDLGDSISRTVEGAVDDIRDEAAREQEDEAEAGEAEPAAGQAVLTLQGTHGTEFAGKCAANGNEKEIRGEVPARYTFTGLDEDGIECEIRKQNPDGKLKVDFAAGGARSAQSMTGEGSTAEIDYEDGSVSSKVTGGGSSSTVSSSQPVR